MGCDFYVYPYLEIEHKGGIAYYPLKILRGYFLDLELTYDDSDDEEDDKYYDDDEYNAIRKQVEAFQLKPRKPVEIFCSGEFKNDALREKYMPLLKNKIDKKYIYENYFFYEDSGKKLDNISDIIKVTKLEFRYECGESPGMYRI